MNEPPTRVEQEMERLKAENAELREALKRYGAHQPPCPLRYNMSMHGCRCGLWDAQFRGQSAATDEESP